MPYAITQSQLILSPTSYIYILKTPIKIQIKMQNFMNLFILFLMLTCLKASSQPYKTLVAPLKKDTKTSLFSIILNFHEHYVIDLSAPFSWQRCPSNNYPSVPCFSTECFQAQYLPSPSCSLTDTTSKNPCFCRVTPLNPITKTCALAKLTTKKCTMYLTNGTNPMATITSNDTYLSCAPSSLFRSFPRGVLGMASLSRAPLALPSQFSNQIHGVTRKFAICLPTTSLASGVVFFGDGPYKLYPPMDFDASSLLSYTPLLINPKSADYFIGIKALSISGSSIPMSPYEGVKISTMAPYTTLRTDIYELFLKIFTKAMNGIPRVKPIKPFGRCYNASAIGFSRVGLHVPQIDLEFDNGKNWTIYGANSMKQIGGDVACFAFMDGGKTPEHTVVIGLFQMEDNLLLFDLDQSRMGFSSSLLFERMSCGNFNFTSND